MNLKEIKVFIPVDVNERVPEDGKIVPVLTKPANVIELAYREGVEWTDQYVRVRFAHGEITHWLEEKQAIVLSKDQLVELLEECGHTCDVGMGVKGFLKSKGL